MRKLCRCTCAVLILLASALLTNGDEPKPGERLFPKNGESTLLTTTTGIMTGVDVLADLRLVERGVTTLLVDLGGQVYRVNPDDVIVQREVAAYCRKKIAEGPSPSENWHTMLATDLLERGEFLGGLAEVRKAVEIKATFTNQRLFTMLLLKAEQYDDALSQIDSFAIRYGHNYFTLGNRASALTGLGRFDDAIRDLDQARKLVFSPVQETECLNLMSRIKMKTGDSAGAKKDLEESLRIVPKNPTALNRIAWLLATCRDEKLRDPALALTYVQELMKLPNAQTPSHRDTYAAVLAGNGAFSKAKEQMRIAIEKLPEGSKQLSAFEERLVLYEQGKAYVEKSP